MQYRVSFAFYTVANFFAVAIELVTLWVMFTRFGNLPGWTMPQTLLLYGMVHIAFGLAEMAGRGFDQFERFVKSGDFDRFLLRPRPTTLLLAGQIFEISRLGR